MEIELIRHGETQWQAEGRYQGRSDVPLSPAGRAALRPANRCPPVVYVTSLRRTGETAALLFPQARRTAAPGLEEMDFGAFEGRSFREMADDAAYRAWVDGDCLGPCPGGESKEGFCRRVCEGFETLMETALGRGEASLTLVAHGGTVMALMERFGAPKRPYFEWHIESGEGLLLRAENWPREKTLRLLTRRSYVK
ncbi:MAG: histidine phosphatase family protein [Oscillospiraceae bacterium]|nr:histidine phosphatase family protein [Oscillospiraceae bacterium]